MSTEYMSTEELQEALRKRNVKETRPASFVVGLVKQADGGDNLLVSQTGCADWIEIPTKMITKTKFVGKAQCGKETYPVALIFLANTDDLFARVAYKLLEQLGTCTRGRSSDAPCGCKHGADAAQGQASLSRAIDVGPGGLGGLGQFGIHGDCHFEWVCYSCTRCIPWTDICWESTCCDLVAVDCDVGV